MIFSSQTWKMKGLQKANCVLQGLHSSLWAEHIHIAIALSLSRGPQLLEDSWVGLGK